MVGAEIDNREVDDELHDLHRGDCSLPWALDLERGKEIVRVHDDVYEEVQGDDHPADRCLAKQLREAKSGSS